MADFSDEDIAQIEASFLQPMLFLFKHKEEKEYLLQNTKKIFKFVEGLKDDEFTKRYLRTLFYFMIQTFKLKTEEVKEMIQQLPVKNKANQNMVQEEVLTALDEAEQNGLIKGIDIGKEQGINIGLERGIDIGKKQGISIGKEQGIEIGKEIGKEKGQKLTELKKSIETIVGLLKNFPALHDIDMSIICKVEEVFVAKVRTVFQTNDKKQIKKFVRDTYQVVPNMIEKDYEEMEQITLKLWKEWKE